MGRGGRLDGICAPEAPSIRGLSRRRLLEGCVKGVVSYSFSIEMALSSFSSLITHSRASSRFAVAQLKTLLKALKQFPFVDQHPSGPPKSFSYAKKQDLVDMFNRYIFTDATYGTVDPAALRALSAATVPPSTSSTNPTSAERHVPHSSIPASTIRRPVAYVPPRSSAVNASTIRRVAYFPPSSAVAANESSSFSGRPTGSGRPLILQKSPASKARKSLSGQKRQLPGTTGTAASLRMDYAGGQALGGGAAASASNNNPWLGLAPSATNTDAPPVYVKGEYSLPEEVPHNDQERRILGTLQGMGFDNTMEILTSIRKLVARQPQSTTSAHHHPAFCAAPSISSDSVMFDIISTREEADESKKMDEARRQSERSRKEEGERRRRILDQQYQQQLENGTIDAWRADSTMFPKSWILQDVASCHALEAAIASNREAKMELIALLKLEKQAAKWFAALPRAYVIDCIVPRICAAALTNTMVENTAGTSAAREPPAWLSTIVKTLQHVLFDLTQQNKNGVPFVFLEAHDAWCLRNPGANETTQGVHDDDSDDDCVVVVTEAPTADSRATASVENMAMAASPRKSIGETIDLTDTTGSSSPPKLSAVVKALPEIIEIL